MNAKKVIIAGIRTIWTTIRLSLGKILHGGRLTFRVPTCLALSDSVSLSKNGSADFGKGIRTRGGCSINVQESGRLVFGENVFLNKGCLLNCHSHIVIGDGCEFGPNVLIYDHDHDFKKGNFKEGNFTYGTVTIGKDCWIGANTVILQGTSIGEGSVIAAGSIVKGDVPAHSLLVQKRTTEIRSI